MGWDVEDDEYEQKNLLTRRLFRMGFEILPADIDILHDGFQFVHVEPPTYDQLDQLAGEFKTHRIDFVKHPGFEDTYGHHPDGRIVLRWSVAN